MAASIQDQITATTKSIKGLQDQFNDIDWQIANAKSNIANDQNQIASNGKRPSIKGKSQTAWDKQDTTLKTDLAKNQTALNLYTEKKSVIQGNINSANTILSNLNKASAAVILAAPGEALAQAKANETAVANQAAIDLAKIQSSASNKKYWIIGGIVLVVIIAIVVVIYIRK